MSKKNKGESNTEAEKLEAEIAGWIVVGIEQVGTEEAIFALVVQERKSGGKRKSVTIHATDLGWWVGRIEKRKSKDMRGEPCSAVIHHGPGHQSKTPCYLRGPHEIHETRYGSYDQLARWKGDDVFSGYFDEPPDDPEEES